MSEPGGRRFSMQPTYRPGRPGGPSRRPGRRPLISSNCWISSPVRRYWTCPVGSAGSPARSTRPALPSSGSMPARTRSGWPASRTLGSAMSSGTCVSHCRAPATRSSTSTTASATSTMSARTVAAWTAGMNCCGPAGCGETRTFRVRLYTATELIGMPTGAGFVDVEAFGGLDRTPLDPSTRLAIRAYRP